MLTRQRLPEWLRQDFPEPGFIARLRSFKEQGVNTVCLEAKCPNFTRCLACGSIAFMILGDACSRGCRFCAVGQPKQSPSPPDEAEPYRILKAVRELKLDFIIITSVTRDDLADRGAGQFSRTIRLIRDYQNGLRIEILIPEILGIALSRVVEAGPDVLAHNLETVPRLYSEIRPGASYVSSLQVLAQARQGWPGPAL